MAGNAGDFFEDHRESKDLGRLALRSGIVSVAMQYGNGVLQIIGAIVLARLLGPEDFGLVAIVTVLTSFAPLLIDFGLGDATAQRQKITQSRVSTLFWLSSGIGLLMTLVVAACAPLIAWLFHDPRLEAIARYASITFVLLGMSNQHLALLRRTMRFGTIAKIRFLGDFVGAALAIFMALRGHGYWALVARPITSALCIVVGAWLACRWRPGLPRIDSDVKSMLRFGFHVVGFSITYSLSRAVDRIGLGLYYQPAVVGYYQNAVTLYQSSILTALSQLHTVGSTALSKLQANPAALREKYKTALSTLAFFVMPAAAILSVTAEDVTVLLLGEKWRPAGLLLAILALRGIFQVIEGSQGWLHLSIGRPDRWRNWGIVTLIAGIVAVLGGLRFGAQGVAAAGVAASMLIAVPSISYAGRPIGIDAALVVRAVGPQLVGAFVTVAGGWWLQTTALIETPSFVRILVSAGFCTSVYLIVVVGLFGLTEPLKIATNVALDRLNRPKNPRDSQT